MSLLSWERGLKFVLTICSYRFTTSLLSWERGLKSRRSILLVKNTVVAPLVGAWIEMLCRRCYLRLSLSLLSWERGLKSSVCSKKPVPQKVAPLVGAWIEISQAAAKCCLVSVAPLVGAWIEIFHHTILSYGHLSLLSWERGLKFNVLLHDSETGICRSSRGSVD